MSGKAGLGRNDKPILAKTMGDGCKKNCRFTCHTRISYESRKKMFVVFWALTSKKDKWQFIADLVEVQKSDADGDRTYKQKEIKHHFFLENSDKKKIKVCKKMFLETLGKFRIEIIT